MSERQPITTATVAPCPNCGVPPEVVSQKRTDAWWQARARCPRCPEGVMLCDADSEQEVRATSLTKWASRYGWRVETHSDPIATLRELGARILANPNDHGTSQPIWEVQERERDYRYDEAIDDTHVWLDDDHNEVREPDEIQRLNDHWDDHDEAPDGYTRCAYVDRWVTVTVCFSRQGADDYIRVNGHNLTDPRIYVDSLYRNHEMIAVRDALMALATGWPKTQIDLPGTEGV